MQLGTPTKQVRGGYLCRLGRGFVIQQLICIYIKGMGYVIQSYHVGGNCSPLIFGKGGFAFVYGGSKLILGHVAQLAVKPYALAGVLKQPLMILFLHTFLLGIH